MFSKLSDVSAQFASLSNLSFLLVLSVHLYQCYEHSGLDFFWVWGSLWSQHVFTVEHCRKLKVTFKNHIKGSMIQMNCTSISLNNTIIDNTNIFKNANIMNYRFLARRIGHCMQYVFSHLCAGTMTDGAITWTDGDTWVRKGGNATSDKAELTGRPNPRPRASKMQKTMRKSERCRRLTARRRMLSCERARKSSRSVPVRTLGQLCGQ